MAKYKMINYDDNHTLWATWHYGNILPDIPGFTFPDRLPEQMNALKPRPEHKGMPGTTGEERAWESPLRHWGWETLQASLNF